MRKTTIFGRLLLMCTVTMILSGCTTMFENGAMTLRPDVRDEGAMMSALKAGGDLDTAKNVFQREPECVYADPTNGLSWAHWYYSCEQETWRIGFFQNVTTYKWDGVYAHCKFKDGRLIGVILPNTKWGDWTTCTEDNWVCQKFLVPKIQQHSDKARGKAWYFDDIGHHYLYYDAGYVVDHWEGANAIFKVNPVPPGYERVWAVDSAGSNVYCDIPKGSEYEGYYDGKFHYRSPDDIAMAAAISAGLNNAVNTITTSQMQQNRAQMSKPSAQKTNSRQSTTKTTSTSVTIKTPARPRCSAHDCEVDAQGHCPVCSSGMSLF